MTEALIIILILAFLIGSFSWLRPSADEKHRVRLRDHAISEGLKVESIKGDVRTLFEQPGQGALLFLYWAPWTEEASVDGRALLRPLRIDTGHDIAGLPPASGFPLSSGRIRGWMVDRRGLGFVWDESGSLGDLDEPIGCIKRCMGN